MKPGFLFAAFVILCSAITIQAQQKMAGSGKSYAKITEATVQRTLPGRPEGEIQTDYRFALTWLSTQKPETFFYKSEDVWRLCYAYRTKRVKGTETNREEETDFKDLRKGDKFILIPRKGGKFPIPATIPSSVKKAILFKTNKSKWVYIAVGTIKKKPDIVMP